MVLHIQLNSAISRSLKSVLQTSNFGSTDRGCPLHWIVDSMQATTEAVDWGGFALLGRIYESLWDYAAYAAEYIVWCYKKKTKRHHTQRTIIQQIVSFYIALPSVTILHQQLVASRTLLYDTKR